MKRRTFIAALGGAAAWPFAARGQQAAMPVVALLSARSAEASARSVAAFRKALNKTGYVEGQNMKRSSSQPQQRREIRPVKRSAIRGQAQRPAITIAGDDPGVCLLRRGDYAS
jgi:hypothetical protein